MPPAITTYDRTGAYIEHSMVISNFAIRIGNQIRDGLCRVFGDNVQYKWYVGDEEKTVIPDASINCGFKNRRGNSFYNCPRFVMEVLSPSTEKYDRNEKMELYRQQEIDEYWLADWQRKVVEIYVLDYDEDKKPYYCLFNTVTEENKEELKIVHFPDLKITFEELFNFE